MVVKPKPVTQINCLALLEGGAVLAGLLPMVLRLVGGTEAMEQKFPVLYFSFLLALIVFFWATTQSKPVNKIKNNYYSPFFIVSKIGSTLRIGKVVFLVQECCGDSYDVPKKKGTAILMN